MIKLNKLVKGIGNHKQTGKYYDEWSNTYDQTLLKWSYRAPKKSALFLKDCIKHKPKIILDLACGTGLFAEEILKIYPKSIIHGSDISKKILFEAKKKNIYDSLIHLNFDKIFLLDCKYDLVSCIGALTYSKNRLKLFKNIYNLTSNSGHFIFTHRVDLWKKQNYNNLLKDLSGKWQKIFISKPLLYLPKNNHFTNKIKIKIAILKKF